ncbi:unnamed protein product [Ilex paraguariensis]|uniref:RRM domain-containing protein n=1 Tax=Ilex paraguariensis TaxID=185542 RepID=A0ABC8TDC1_9AQUA
MSASEIGEEFKKFGRLKPDGVAIRTRKDIDVRYAFVEFEDTTGVQNAVEASTVQIAGHQLYIEGRRANRNNSFQGGRGRGRGSYQMDASRGRFGARSFGRGSGPDGGDRDYNRPRGNGFYRQGPRQDRVLSVEIKSVYVRNVPSSMSASEIGEEFKKFGRLKPDGVAIRTRKDIDVRYAFVEFEDTTGVQNAVEASTVQIAGHQLYIEGRRANRNNSFQGGRGRGRGSYQMDASRGRFGARSFGRGSGPDGGDRDYNRPRGNGFYRQGPRQDRVLSGNHQM